jgi:hypothetical protein
MLPMPVPPATFATMFPGRKYLFDLGAGAFDHWRGDESRP